MRTLMKRLNVRCTTAAASLRSILRSVGEKKRSTPPLHMPRSLERAAALAVLGVLLLGAGLNAQGAKSAARKGGGGNAKGGELKAKLAANEVLQRNNAAGAKCLYACACLRMWARVRYVRARG